MAEPEDAGDTNVAEADEWYKGAFKPENEFPNIKKGSFWSPLQFKDEDGEDQDEESFGAHVTIQPWGGGEEAAKWLTLKIGIGFTHEKLNASYGAEFSAAAEFSSQLGTFEGKLGSGSAEITVAAIGFEYKSAGVVGVELGEGSKIEINLVEGAQANRKFLTSLWKVKMNEAMKLEAKDKELTAALSRTRAALVEARSGNATALFAQMVNI